MNCSLEDQVLRAEAGQLPATEQESLREHLEQCPQCQGALDTMASAREILKQNRRAPHPSARARVWALVETELERESSKGSFVRWALVPAGAVLLTLLVFLMIPGSAPRGPSLQSGRLLAGGEALEVGRALPERTAFVAQAEVRISSPNAEFEFARGATFQLLPYASELAVDLTGGALTISALDTPSATVVRAKTVLLAVVAGRVSLEVDGERTELRVSSGRVRVEQLSAETSEILEAGAVRSFEGSSRSPEWESGLSVREAQLGQVDEQPRRSDPRPRPAARPTADTKSLEAAREALPGSPKRARELAKEVLARRPEPRLEVAALALMADAERRSGRLRDALQSYGRVVDHIEGETYAEEAMLRQAILLDQLGESKEALKKLANAERRHPDGVLSPERATLEARLHMDEGTVEAAARSLERVSDAAGSLSLARLRVEVAQALLPRDPARAARLAELVLDAPDASLRRRAAKLVSSAR